MGSKVVLDQVRGDRERAKLYNSFNGFFYDLKDVGRYGVSGTLDFKASLLNELHEAGEDLWRVFKNVETLVKGYSESQLLKYGYPIEIIPYLKLDYCGGSALSRFDFIVDDETGDIKAIELNNDTPFLIVESFLANNKVCEYYGKSAPYQSPEKSLADTYIQSIEKGLDWLRSGNDSTVNLKSPNVSLLTYAEELDEEEYLTMEFLTKTINENLPIGVAHSPSLLDISSMRISYGEAGDLPRGLYDENGNRIEVLIRPAYPLEFLIHDVAEDGSNVGVELLKLVKEKRLAIISDPSSIIMQSKAFMAIIWELHEQGKLSNKDSLTVEKYMLPTYFEKEVFTSKRKPYVTKPVFSREGSSVEIHENGRTLASSDDTYKDHMNVYQKYTKMPILNVNVNRSKEKKYLLVGLFMGLDKPIGVGARLGAKITDWNANWIGIAKD